MERGLRRKAEGGRKKLGGPNVSAATPSTFRLKPHAAFRLSPHPSSLILRETFPIRRCSIDGPILPPELLSPTGPRSTMVALSPLSALASRQLPGSLAGHSFS